MNRFDLPVKVERPSPKPEFQMGANSHKGILLSLLQKFNKDAKAGVTYTPYELSVVFSEALTKYNEITKNTKATVKLTGWKGKSGINIIEKPDSLLVIAWQKLDQDSDPKEIQRVIYKDELNQVIGAINLLNVGKKIKTCDIAEQFCKLREVYQNHEGKNLFENNIFQWGLFYSDRFLHTQLNLCLRVLDHYQVIKYRGGRSQVLKKVLDIQTEL